MLDQVRLRLGRNAPEPLKVPGTTDELGYWDAIAKGLRNHLDANNRPTILTSVDHSGSSLLRPVSRNRDTVTDSTSALPTVGSRLFRTFDFG